MTLLVGYASPEYAILASDRMATWTVPQRVGGRTVYKQKYEEQITKTTFFVGQYLIGYSGVADLGKDKNTEYWLVDQLSELTKPANRTPWTHQLMDALVRELVKVRGPLASRWFSLMIVGYTPDPQTGEFGPALRVISTAKTQNYGDWRVGNNLWSADLTVDTRGSDFSLWAVGSPPKPVEKLEYIADVIRRYRKHAPDRALEIARTMARVIVARSTETPGVGDTVQVAILPKVATGQQNIGMTLGPIVEPLTATTSFEFNSKERDGFTLINGINGVIEGMAFRDGVVAPDGPFPIGPPPPFKAPS